MKKLASCLIASVGVIATPAFAADMAVKAPPPALAPVYNWTGWYVGGNLGASFGRVKTDFNGAPVTVSIPGTPPIPVSGFATSDTVYPSGFIGGGQIGYNWQLSPIWVVGLEADIQGALEKESGTPTVPVSGSVPCGGGPCTATGTAVTQYEAKIDWFGTVRGRIGYLWGNGEALTYVTGGLGYGKVELNATSTVSGTAFVPGGVPFTTTHAFSHSQLKAGWVVGFGTEGKLLIPGWTYKIESLYIDLGDADPVDICEVCSPATSGGLIAGRGHFTDAILRAGLNYQFH
jgi:outer membrane immunogenic protein